MADNASFPDDISTLWGDSVDGALEPARRTSTPNGHGATPAPRNGSSAEVPADDDDGITRLADALASRQADVVRQADLLRTRAELEDAFAQQLTAAGLAGSAADAEKMLDALAAMTGMLSALQADVTRLHAAVDGLREEATVLRRRTDRVRSLRGRSFPQPGGGSPAHDDSQG